MNFFPLKKALPFALLLIIGSGCKKDFLDEDLIVTSVDTTNVAVHVTVDARIVKNDISKQYKGVNITENWEDQSYWNYPTAPATTIKTINPNIIRAGNDDVFWSEPPYNKPKPCLINYGPYEYLSYQTDIVEPDGIHMKSRYLDIDEYVALCRATGSEPEIIIPYNRIYYKGQDGTHIATKEDFLKNAETLVNYANKVKGYNIKFWEIGNESWQPSTNVTATNYRDDLKLFSKRMKAVDPSIKIIANGRSSSWFETVLAGAAESIDYINISYYPVYPYSGYNFYSNYNVTYGNDGDVQNALQALNASKPGKDIKLIVTEFNAAEFGGPWKDNNDLGHALVSFQIGADMMSNPSIYFSSFWNIRWYYGYQPNGVHWLPIESSPKTIMNAADNQGNLNANGTSLSILYNNFSGAIVDAQSDNQVVRPYACVDKNNGKTNLFLLNKSALKQGVKVDLKNFGSVKKAEVWVFTGSGDSDTNPKWQRTTSNINFNATGTSATLTLSAESVTMIKLK